jgi:GntR family transcriptional regulator
MRYNSHCRHPRCRFHLTSRADTMHNIDSTTAAIGTTLYREVKRQVLAALAANEWNPGEAIPSEKRLCERFGVSIGTLRKAIDDLVAENILIRHQGRGTFVATHTRGGQGFRFFNIARHDGTKNYPTPTLVSFRKGKADKTAREKLGLPAGARVFQFSNVLSVEGEPVLVDDIVLPEALFGGLTEAMLRNRPSTLYDLYQNKFGLNVIGIEERLRASLAGETHAGLLGIAPGAPLLEVHRVAFSYHQQPVEWRVSHVNTERYEYFARPAQ